MSANPSLERFECNSSCDDDEAFYWLNPEVARLFKALRFLAIDNGQGKICKTFLQKALPTIPNLQILKVHIKHAFIIISQNGNHLTLKYLFLKDGEQPLKSVLDCLAALEWSEVLRNYPQLQSVRLASVSGAIQGALIGLKREDKKTTIIFEKFGTFYPSQNFDNLSETLFFLRATPF